MSCQDMILQPDYIIVNDRIHSGKSPDILSEKAVFALDSSSFSEEGMDESTSVQYTRMKRKCDSSDSGDFSNKLCVMPGVIPQDSSDVTSKLNSPSTIKSSNRETSSRNQKTTGAGKRKKIDLTLEWLEENYMICEGVCLARCILYSHYKDFCEKNGLDPSCAATFGKTIRQKFPKVTTRRLGMRGHSKYHYYGIGIRETSIYYHSVYAGKGLTRYSPKVKPEDDQYMPTKINSPHRNCYDSFLEDFPDVSSSIAESGNKILGEQVQHFINFYKCLCRQIVTSAQNKNFKTLSNNLVQFWSDLPFKQYPNFSNNNLVVDLTTLCDVLLYEVLIDVLLPIPCDDINERHLLEVEALSKQCEEFLKNIIVSTQDTLIGKKKLQGQHFAQYLLRHVSFIKLNRAVRRIFSSSSTFLPLRNDLEKIHLQNSLGSQTFYSRTSGDNKETSINKELLKDLKDLLKRNASTENLIEWLDAIVDAKVIKPSKQNGRSLKKRSHDFLLKWSFFGATIMHNLNNTNASNFNSFHYLRMFLDEYVMLAIETQFNNDKRQEIKKIVAKHTKNCKTSQSSNNLTQESDFSKSACHSNIYPKQQFETRNSFKMSKLIPPRWNNYSTVYEGLQKSEHTVDPYVNPHMEAHSYVTCHSYAIPTWSYSDCSPSVFSTEYEASNSSSTYSQQGNETVIYENGSTFTYLNGTTTGKQETCFNFYHSDSCEIFNHQDERSASVSPLKTNFNFNGNGTEYRRHNSESRSHDYLISPRFNPSRSPHYGTKYPHSPASFSETNGSPQTYYSEKEPNKTFKENVYQIQDLSYSCIRSDQSGATLKEYSTQKHDCKLHHSGYGLIEENYTTLPGLGNAMTSSLTYGDPFLHSSGFNDANSFSFHNNQESWTNHGTFRFGEKFSGEVHSVSGPHHAIIYHENLPSISSVLNTE